MIPFKHILVATDFGAASRAALELAISIASRYESKVTLLHVYSVPAVDFAEGFYWPVDELERVSRRMLDATVAEVSGRCPRLEAKLAFGDPAQHILESAAQHEADAIIVGTHGRRGIARALLGSVADKIVRLSPIPVLVVPEPSKAETSTVDAKKGGPLG